MRSEECQKIDIRRASAREIREQGSREQGSKSSQEGESGRIKMEESKKRKNS
jgi:hypothetical protein